MYSIEGSSGVSYLTGPKSKVFETSEPGNNGDPRALEIRNSMNDLPSSVQPRTAFLFGTATSDFPILVGNRITAFQWRAIAEPMFSTCQNIFGFVCPMCTTILVLRV